MKWLSVTVIFFVGLVVLVNVPDGELDPQLNGSMNPPSGEVAVSDNDFFYTLGFFAPEEGDPQEYGHDDFLHTIHSWRDAPYATTWARAKFSGEEQYRRIAGDIESCRDTQDWVCLAQAASSHVAANKTLLDRYRHLLTSRTYWEELVHAPPQLSMFVTPGPMLVQPMLLSNIATDYTRGNRVRALQALQQDIRFTRKQLSGTNSLFMFMVAQQMVKRDYLLLSEILSTPGVFLPNEKAAILQMATPLSRDELPLGRVLDGIAREKLADFRWSDGAMGQRVNPTILSVLTGFDENADLMFFPTRSVNFNYLLVPFFKANDSASIVYRALKQEKERWNARGAAFDSSRSETDVPTSSFEAVLRGLRYLRNPVGTVMADRNKPEVLGYMQRSLDLDGFVKLVALKARWRLAAGSIDGVPAFAASHPDLFDPYTGKPMRWNGKQIYFDAKNPRARVEGIDSVRLH